MVLGKYLVSFFRGSGREVQTIVEDFMPPGMGKRAFTGIVNEATAEKFSFLQVDLERTVEGGRYRAQFNERVV